MWGEHMGGHCLTTTLDGLWVFQVLSGIEVVAPEVGLRPHLPSTETNGMALAHPVADELREAGVINYSGEVDDAVLEWLTVLSRRDVRLARLRAYTCPRERTGTGAAGAFRPVVGELERNGILVRVVGVGTATTETAAALLIHGEIERLCGEMTPAAPRRSPSTCPNSLPPCMTRRGCGPSSPDPRSTAIRSAR